jgi:hypothetical protein
MHQGMVTAHSSADDWLCHACKRSNNTVHVRMDASRVMKAGKTSIAQQHTNKASCNLSLQSVCRISLHV